MDQNEAMDDSEESSRESMDDNIKNESQSESESSDDSSAEEDIEDVDSAEAINQLQQQTRDDPYNYQNHVDLISKLRNTGELELIRAARETMSRLFPLTPQLWLSWIGDETSIATTEQERANVLKLFARSVADYVSAKLWLEYVQYSIGLMGPLGVDGVRQIFERALTSVGLDVVDGGMIWETYREFECALLQTIDADSADTEPSQQTRRQMDRVSDLFKRQLSVPLMDMEKTLEEYKQWCDSVKQKYAIEINSGAIKATYDKSVNELQKLIAYEESLKSSEAPHLEQYLRYIEYETINGTPMRVQSIYERAIVDNCLNSDLWLKYTKYCDKVIVIEDLLSPIYERATRNCPWSSTLWVSYLKSMERLRASHERILSVFEAALQSGFQSADDYRQIWLTYLDYLRRKTNWKDENDVKSIRKTFEKAVEHVSKIDNCDPNHSILIYWAKVEAKFCNDISRARQLWNDLLKENTIVASQVQFWIEFSNLERKFGDDKHYRKVLMRGLNASTDWPESIGQLLITYEREEGESIEAYEEVLNKYENIIKKITEKRVAAAEREAETKKQFKMQRKQEKYELKRASKRRADPNTGDDLKTSANEGFKVPEPKTFAPFNKRYKSDDTSRRERRESSNRDEQKREESQKSDQPSHGVSYKGDGTKDLQTVFLSNLDFKLDENRIRSAFEKFGTITDLRLVRNYRGMSKGYCYVEYSSISESKEALKHDRMPLEGRPVFISEMGRRAKFHYSTSIEKNKLFVKNLAPEVTNEQLVSIFNKFGSIKDARIVTYRNGHSKGCAYVEYLDEVSAAEAVKQANGLLVNDKNIIVSISNPSSTKSSADQIDVPSLGSGKLNVLTATGARTKTRINAPMIPTALRIQRQSSQAEPNGENSHSSNGKAGLSNSDFRSLLLNK